MINQDNLRNRILKRCVGFSEHIGMRNLGNLQNKKGNWACMYNINKILYFLSKIVTKIAEYQANAKEWAHFLFTDNLYYQYS